MNALILEKQTAQLASWRTGALGLLVLSVLVNMAMMARITALEARQQTVAAQYQKQIEEAEHARDLAVQELQTIALRQAKEQQAREAQAEAYEALAGYTYIGECTVTYYCPCEECCGKWADGITATGLPAGPGIVAVDPEVIPLGSTVIIDGQKYLAADTGGTGKHVDVCLADHAATVEAGVRTAEVWMTETDACERKEVHDP